MTAKRFNSIDCLKGLACMAVVFIHFNFPGNPGIFVKTFCRFAVPVFFITSGFFFLSNGSMDDGKVAQKIRHILKLAIFSSLFYAVFTYLINSATSQSWNLHSYIQTTCTVDKIIKLFVTNDPFVYSHLWFLMALVYTYVLCLLLFEDNKRLSLVPVLAPALLIGYSCLQEFGGVLGIQRSVPIPGTESRVYLFNLFLFRAMPFFLFGILLKRYQKKIAGIPLNTAGAAVLVILGGCCAIVERFTFGVSQFYVGSYIMLAAMFILAIKHPEMDRPALIHIGRDLSLYVYIFHIAVGRCVDTAFGMLGLKESALYSYGRSPTILVVSLLIAELIYQFKKSLGQRPSSTKKIGDHMLKKFKQYQFLFEELVKRDFKKKYKRTFLGMAWSVLSPLLMLLIMRLVFTQFFGHGVAHYTTYLFCGNLIFSYFSESTSQGMTSLVGNAPIFSKVNVPKYLFLFSKNVQTLINFGLTLCVFFLFCLLDGITFTWKFILLLYPVGCLVLFNIGVGLILSALFVFFRDIQYLWSIFTQLLMYMSAIFYTVDHYSPLGQRLFLLNPIYVFITYFRKIVIEASVPSTWFHLLMAAYAAGVVCLGCWMYKKFNTRFLYYV